MFYRTCSRKDGCRSSESSLASWRSRVPRATGTTRIDSCSTKPISVSSVFRLFPFTFLLSPSVQISFVFSPNWNDHSLYRPTLSNVTDLLNSFPWRRSFSSCHLFADPLRDFERCVSGASGWITPRWYSFDVRECQRIWFMGEMR